jgi:hypothetical protein
MQSKRENSPVQQHALGDSAFDAVQMNEKVQSMAPPAFGFSGETAQLKTEEASGSTANTSAPVQMNEPRIRGKDKKTAEYGPVETGPIAEQGPGDAHAVDRSDVNQGALGDCYLLASMMALADSNPDLLRNAINGPKDDGTYDVTLYKKKGVLKKTFEAQTVNVTSSFVKNKDWGTDHYARGGDMDATGQTEMWVRLIEKAYAKMKGGFGKIHGGFEEDALEALTGKEHSAHGFNGFLGMGKMSDADLKTAIQDALSAGKPVTASTKFQFQVNGADKKEGDFGKNNDIVGLHAYSVVAADDTNITLRNPWGNAAANSEPVLTWAQFRKYFKNFTTED